MNCKVLVMSERSDSYAGKKGIVNQQLINCMDRSDSPAERLVQPIEYALSDEEKVKYAGKLDDKTIVLGLREMTPFGGRLRARGRIIEVLK
jgi:hypothetical protein